MFQFFHGSSITGVSATKWTLMWRFLQFRTMMLFLRPLIVLLAGLKVFLLSGLCLTFWNFYLAPGPFSTPPNFYDKSFQDSGWNKIPGKTRSVKIITVSANLIGRDDREPQYLQSITGDVFYDGLVTGSYRLSFNDHLSEIQPGASRNGDLDVI